ncbi:MAG: type IV pili methyl-accepting chemotaxis transducer N-terminal domain-containing protein [Desulfuromusa sp.]|nr:type IV pili methyl-accepting chemotaxis transducer N-terminal domain-containing protein [Desulfuromusa sp.]
MSQPKSIGLSAKLTGAICVITLICILLVAFTVITLKNQKNDSTVINIAGRQRMLSQKMSKEAMTIKAGLSVEKSRTSLKETHDLFASSLNGLINGNNSMHLPPTIDPDILAQMRKVETLWKDFSTQVQVLLNAKGKSEKTILASEKIKNNNVTLLQEMNKAVGMYAAQSQKKVARLSTALYIGGVIVLVVTFLVWLLINRKIVRPLRSVVQMVDGMNNGDLDHRLNMNQGDEIGQLANDMDQFADRLKNDILTAFHRLAEGDFTFAADGLIAKPLAEANQAISSIIQNVLQSSQKIASDTLQVSGTSTSLADGATKQAAALEEISASMQEMNEQTASNTRNAEQVNQLSSAAKLAAEKGNQHMQAMIKAMAEINDAGQNISKIIKVIDEIAFQTNLLALNAAVEAARAGQHGKGFAVVAEEVRNLAARSAKAAGETTELIQSSVEKTKNGAQIADQTAAALKEIYQGVAQVSDLVDEIAAASSEQSLGVAQANEGLAQLSAVNQSSTASAEETAAIAEELSAQTSFLQQMLERFKILGSSYGASPMQLQQPAPSSAPQPQYQPQPHPQPATNEPWGGSAPAKVIQLDDDDFGKY